MIQRHGIAYHEKTLGQLFCDGSSKEVVAMLRSYVMRATAELWLQTSLKELRKTAAIPTQYRHRFLAYWAAK